jgi:hypothetical protein
MLEARVGLAMADQPLLVGEEHGGADQPHVVPVAELHVRADRYRANNISPCSMPMMSLSMGGGDGSIWSDGAEIARPIM